MTVKLPDLEPPLEPLEFANGRVYHVRPLGAVGRRLLDELRRRNDPARVRALLQHIVPDATDDDLAELSPREAVALLAHASGGITPAVAAALKQPGPIADVAAAAGRAMTNASPTRPHARQARMIQ